MYPQPQHFGTSMAYSPTTPNNSCSALPFTSSMVRSSSVSAVPLLGSGTTSTNIANTRNHSRSRKRPISGEDESTDEESESNTSSHKSLQMADTSLDSGCHLMSRKKRRGMIEKRRRDRINNSLHELKRLVPAAFEKQGSAKLEKAEILQMTVDHLRMLHSKGFDAFSFDPHKFATDYHLIGFRECAAEIARYLVVHEGIDFQDPLRLRLISHLQCYSAQREISLKSSTGWNPSLFTTPIYPTPASAAVVNSTSNSSNSSISVAPTTSTTSSSTASSTLTTLNNVNSCETSMNVLQNPTTSSSSQHSQNNSYAASASATYSHYSHHPPPPPPHHHHHHQQNPQQYEKLDNGVSPSSSMQCNSQQSSTSNQIKSPMSPMATFTTLGYPSTAAGSSIPTSPSSTSVNSYSYAPYPPPGSYFAPTPTYMTTMVPAMGGVGGIGNQSGGVVQSNGASNQTVNSVKHYRPWGTELAY